MKIIATIPMIPMIIEDYNDSHAEEVEDESK